jgi:hypothetical protein
VRIPQTRFAQTAARLPRSNGVQSIWPLSSALVVISYTHTNNRLQWSSQEFGIAHLKDAVVNAGYRVIQSESRHFTETLIKRGK